MSYLQCYNIFFDIDSFYDIEIWFFAILDLIWQRI